MFTPWLRTQCDNLLSKRSRQASSSHPLSDSVSHATTPPPHLPQQPPFSISLPTLFTAHPRLPPPPYSSSSGTFNFSCFFLSFQASWFKADSPVVVPTPPKILLICEISFKEMRSIFAKTPRRSS